MNTESEIKWRW